jgi:hypothetical protein
MTPEPAPPARVAIYFTPPRDHALTRMAADWLGRDAFTSADRCSDVFHSFGNVTKGPRRYGFHATLKAPFRLRDGLGLCDVENALASFVETTLRCNIGPLRVAQLGEAFALVPTHPNPWLRALASRIVAEFDHFRAPMTSEEFHRRLSDPLDEVETTNLVQWGYPYVFDRFQFHMTLATAVPSDQAHAVRDCLEGNFGPLLAETYSLDALSLFVQQRPTEAFFVHSSFPLLTPALAVKAV